MIVKTVYLQTMCTTQDPFQIDREKVVSSWKELNDLFIDTLKRQLMDVGVFSQTTSDKTLVEIVIDPQRPLS